MRYYNFETMFLSLKNELIKFLEGCEKVLAYEISRAGSYYHFEILTDPNGAEAINSFIDSVSIREEVKQCF